MDFCSTECTVPRTLSDSLQGRFSGRAEIWPRRLSSRIYLASARAGEKNASNTNYMQIIVDFEKSVIYALLLRVPRGGELRRKLWVHPLISQRPIKGQLYKIYKNLRRIPKKNIFHFNNTFLCVKTEHEEAGRLDTTADIECRNQNTPEPLFGHRCARIHLLTFVIGQGGHRFAKKMG